MASTTPSAPGGGGLISDDGYTWHSGAVRPGGGVAPDVIKIGDRYYVAYAVGGGGMSGGHASKVKIMWTKTLDPKSPDFAFHDIGIVASSDGVEDCDAIDPAFLYAKGHLWLSYGTYFGFIRIVELDPKTGKRIAGQQAGQCGHRHGSHGPDVSRWLVLPAGHARHLLRRRQLHLQHSRGPLEEPYRALRR